MGMNPAKDSMINTLVNTLEYKPIGAEVTTEHSDDVLHETTTRHPELMTHYDGDASNDSFSIVDSSGKSYLDAFDFPGDELSLMARVGNELEKKGFNVTKISVGNDGQMH